MSPLKQPPIPSTITKDFHTKMLHMFGAAPWLENALKPLLKPAEIDGVIKRLEQMLREGGRAGRSSSLTDGDSVPKGIVGVEIQRAWAA